MSTMKDLHKCIRSPMISLSLSIIAVVLIIFACLQFAWVSELDKISKCPQMKKEKCNTSGLMFNAVLMLVVGLLLSGLLLMGFIKK